MKSRIIQSWISTFFGVAIAAIATFYLFKQFETLTLERSALYVLMYLLAAGLIFAKDKELIQLFSDVLNKKL